MERNTIDMILEILIAALLYRLGSYSFRYAMLRVRINKERFPRLHSFITEVKRSL